MTFTEHGSAVVRGLETGSGELAALLFADLPEPLLDHVEQGQEAVLDQVHQVLADQGGTE